MSSNFYRTRVIYDGKRQMLDGTHGSAKTEEVEVKFFGALPPIEGLPRHVTEIDYAPQVRCAELRELSERRREMHPPEVEALTRWLGGILNAVRKQIEISSNIKLEGETDDY